DAPDGTWRMYQEDIDRVQEFRKCIECFLCQDVCHVLRDHHKHDEFIGPRFFVNIAALEMHPLDTEDRLPELKEAQGLGYCNITKCCTKVCPEHITITDNAIIPMKERIVGRYYDPISKLLRVISGRSESSDESYTSSLFSYGTRSPCSRYRRKILKYIAQQQFDVRKWALTDAQPVCRKATSVPPS